MALTNNPNKTKTIEKNWNREINNRWSRFWLAVKDIPLNSMVNNIDDQEQSELDQFMILFLLMSNQILLGDEIGSAEWQNKYQTQAYERSAQRTVDEAKSIVAADQLALFATSFIAGSLLSLPNNRNEINFLHARANDKLKGWIQLLVNDTSSIIHDNINKVSRNELMNIIKKRLDVTASRARMIATTEITQASQRAVTVQAREIEALIGEEVVVRWITVRDSRVRHLHAGWHGKIFTPAQAEVNMNISPWNCRCGLKPVIIERDSDMLKAKFSAERRILLANES